MRDLIPASSDEPEHIVANKQAENASEPKLLEESSNKKSRQEKQAEKFERNETTGNDNNIR